MSDLLSNLPPSFRMVHYDPEQLPDGDHDLTLGANCQRYAYAVLAHFGIELPPLRSSELWADSTHTRIVSDLQPLDLLFYGRRREPYGAHIAIYAGAGQALHLSRLVGAPAMWFLSEFPLHDRYVCCIGAKRVLAGRGRNIPV